MSDQVISPLHLRAQLQMLDAFDIRQLAELKGQDDAAREAAATRQSGEREQATLRGKLLQMRREQQGLREIMTQRLQHIKSLQAAVSTNEAQLAALESKGQLL